MQWEDKVRTIRTRRRSGYVEPSEERCVEKNPLTKHKGFLKHESSVFIQIQTGKIDLNGFLFKRCISDATTSFYSCKRATETPAHLALDYPLTEEVRERLNRDLTPSTLRSQYNFEAATKHPQRAKTLARWFLSLGRLASFRLALELGGQSKERSSANAAKERRLPD